MAIAMLRTASASDGLPEVPVLSFPARSAIDRKQTNTENHIPDIRILSTISIYAQLDPLGLNMVLAIHKMQPASWAALGEILTHILGPPLVSGFQLPVAPGHVNPTAYLQT